MDGPKRAHLPGVSRSGTIRNRDNQIPPPLPIQRIAKHEYMRTTIALDDELLEKAKALTTIKDNTPLIREALKALIERESARRLAALGGIDPKAEVPPRRRATGRR